MSAGSAFHQTCYPTQYEAMQAACSSAMATGADGSMSTCVGVTAGPSTSSGGDFAGSLRIYVTNAAGTVTGVTRNVSVFSCERYDYPYWSPVIGAWVAALVAIIAARVLYLRVFSRETL